CGKGKVCQIASGEVYKGVYQKSPEVYLLAF
ncbi:unnamed protein product, partial [marine sediment metagenome]